MELITKFNYNNNDGVAIDETINLPKTVNIAKVKFMYCAENTGGSDLVYSFAAQGYNGNIPQNEQFTLQASRPAGWSIRESFEVIMFGIDKLKVFGGNLGDVNLGFYIEVWEL